MTPCRMPISRFSVTSTLQCLLKIASTHKRCDSIEYAPLARFFASNPELPAELADYFASFDLIVSYLYDPDRIFESNLRRCGVENLICGPQRYVKENACQPSRTRRGAVTAARGSLRDPSRNWELRLSILPREFFLQRKIGSLRAKFLGTMAQPIVAIHPGSGSHEKNWPLENWISLFSRGSEFSTNGEFPSLVVISGEADNVQTEQLEREWRNRNVPLRKESAATSTSRSA